MPYQISACIITLNEESNLERCLSSLDFVDEIVVLDSGSTDQTEDIARRFNAKFSFRKFDNYILQKNHAIRMAKHDWVIVIDADEEISPDLKKEILSLTESDMDNWGGFVTPRLTHYMGKWIRHSGWYPNLQIKFFNRKWGEFRGDLVHETVGSQKPFRRLNKPIYHYSYKSIADHINYMNRYSTLSAIQKFKKGKRSGVTKALGKFVYKFIWTYFFRMGFLDGRTGVIVCFLSSYYNFLKYSKLHELEKNPKLASSLLVMVDTVHNVKSKESPDKNSN